MANYLITHFKGTYRIKVPYDQSTNNFPRKLNGTLEDIDCYIDCQKGVKIFYYGKRQLEVYVPSLGRGRNIIKSIYSDFVQDIDNSPYFTAIERENKDGELVKTNLYDYDSFYKDQELNKIIFDITESDEEVIFKFHVDKMDQLEKYLKPRTSGADISPFSTKNLPKSDYKIPDEDFIAYKNIVEKIPKEQFLSLTHSTNHFLQSLATKKNPWENIKADMRLKCMKSKEYIHSINKWDEYIKYLEKELK